MVRIGLTVPHLSRSRRLLFVTALTGCTYGPPRLDLRIANHALAPDAPRAAFAVSATWLRDPTGISAWPDGGVPKVLAEAAAIYVCDTVATVVDRVWRGDRPREIRSAFTPWLGPWTADGLYFSLRGSATKTTTPGALIRLQYRLEPGGRVVSTGQEPTLGPATSEPARCAAAVLAAARADPPARLPH